MNMHLYLVPSSDSALPDTRTRRSRTDFEAPLSCYEWVIFRYPGSLHTDKNLVLAALEFIRKNWGMSRPLPSPEPHSLDLCLLVMLLRSIVILLEHDETEMYKRVKQLLKEGS